MISLQHGLRPRVVKFAAGQVDAPVVDGDRQVEQPLVVAGKVEVEEAAETVASAAVFLEQHVVAEQVAMARAFAQAGVVGAGEERRLMGDLLLQQRALAGVEERQDLGLGLLPPRQAAQVGLAARVVLAGQVHARQHVADFGAVLRVRRQLRGAGQARDDGGGLALERAQDRGEYGHTRCVKRIGKRRQNQGRRRGMTAGGPARPAHAGPWVSVPPPLRQGACMVRTSG
ncbi:hypothetical protein D9M70_446410 [compost metagenome]